MIRVTTLAALAGILSLSACDNPESAKKIAELEKKIEEMEKKAAEAPAAAAAPAQDPGEQAAMELYRVANEAFRAGNNDEAKAKLEELMANHGATRVAQAGKRLLDQLSVVGKKIDKLEVENWFQGETTLADGKATLLVFWEVWCPHCKREVPKLEETYTNYKGKGLNMVGLTKLTRGKTPDEVNAFIAENKITYPIAKESGTMTDFFGVSGVPAAAVVKNGEVVWRGHPAQLNDEMINGWL